MADKNMLKTIKPPLATALFLLTVLSSTSCLAEDKAIATSYSLDKAIHYALDNNPDLKIANERIAQAQAQVGEVMAAFYPQVAARVSYQVSDNPAQVFAMMVAQREFTNNSIQTINNPDFRQNFRPEITGRMSLYRGGQDEQNRQIAELGVTSANLEQSVIRNALVQAVTSSYYSYLAAIEARKVAQNSITAIDSELSQTRKRFNAGTVLRSDVLSLETQLAAAQEAEIKAANGIELAKSSLSILLGLPAGQAFSMSSTSILTPPILAKSFNDLVKQALLQRPEIQAANTQVEMATHQVQSEKGAYLPKVDAFVSYGQDNQNPRYSFSKDNVTAGVMVEVDLFNGFRTKQRVSKAERQLAQAQEQERKARLAVELEVKQAYLKFTEALARLKVTEAAVTSAEEAFKLVKIQRQAETVTVTRYIEAETAANQAHANTIAAHYDALGAEAALKKALGDWK
jgi:outer membrane protein TolC